MTQYNVVVERALGLLRDKATALLGGAIEDKTAIVWFKVMNYAR